MAYITCRLCNWENPAGLAGKDEETVADKPATQKTKRRVRNPETFRERAIKAGEASEKPSRKHRVRGATGSALAKAFGPVGRFFGKVFSYQPFRFIGKVLRFIGRIIWPRYFRNSWKELRLVTWPNWQKSRQLTFAVLIFAVIFGALVAGVDWGLDKVFRQILLK